MAEAAKKSAGIPRCPECDSNTWDVEPDSVGIELGENDSGEWYVEIAWLDGATLTCGDCHYTPDRGSELDCALSRYVCFY